MAKTKTKKKTTPKTPSLYEQAASEMDSKYAPQIQMAQGLLGEAAKTYASDIDEAKNNASAIHAFAEQNKAPTIDRYAKAQGATTTNEQNAASALEGTGPASDIFRRAITASQGTGRSRLTAAGTRASQELDDRQTGALAGKIAAQTQAKGDYRKTKQTLTDQIRGLAGQKEADIMARFGQLAEQQADRQTQIDVAKIGAQSRLDVAGAGADASSAKEAEKARTKAREKRQKHVEGVRTATGTLKQSVADTADLWDQYAARVQYRPNKDDKTNAEFPYLNPNGDPVQLKTSAAKKVMTPDEIRDAIAQDHDVDPGILHIALLRRANKPLDAKAIQYIKSKPDWRIPREWLRNRMDQRIASNEAAGPPRPGV